MAGHRLNDLLAVGSALLVGGLYALYRTGCLIRRLSSQTNDGPHNEALAQYSTVAHQQVSLPHSGDVQGTFRELSGYMQGTFKEYSGNVQGIFSLS
jgi:hypothetical protein